MEPMFFIMPCIMGVVGFFVMKRLIFDLMDEVWMNPDELIIKNGHWEEHMPLENVINVGNTTMSNTQRITLTLRNNCRFGSEITFMPASTGMFTRSTVASELIRAIDAKRTGRRAP